MRSLKKFAALAVAVFALSAIGVASASAAEFTASETGSLEGHATTTQTFTTNGGTVKCSTAKTTGTIAATASTEQHVTVEYSGCTAFGFAKVEISPATYNFHASGSVEIKNTITINVPGAGCKQTVAPQTVSSVAFDNNGGKLIETSTVSGITYTSSGGLCGSSGSNGTYSGNNEVERVGGGSLAFD